MIRVWQLDPERLLTGGVGTLALAPISAVPQGEVPGIIRRMKGRLTGPKAPRKAKNIIAAASVLLGVRYSEAVANALFGEVLGMEESSTYRAIVRKGLEQGRAEGLRRALLLLGKRKFGPPDRTTQSAIDSLSDTDQLEELVLRSETAESWKELVPTARRRNGQRPR